MDARKLKAVLTVTVIFATTAAVPIMGFTKMTVDHRQGLMIDFGNWDVVWADMAFEEGMDGEAVLDVACHIKSYAVVRSDWAWKVSIGKVTGDVEVSAVTERIPVHPITVSAEGDGTVTTDPADAAEAFSWVTVKTVPGEGMRLESLKVTSEGVDVEVVRSKFRMPEAGVQVKAVFSKAETHTSAATAATEGMRITEPRASTPTYDVTYEGLNYKAHPSVDKTEMGGPMDVFLVPEPGYRIVSVKVVMNRNVIEGAAREMPKGSVLSIDGKIGHGTADWGLYNVSGREWIPTGDPGKVDVGEHKLLCWALAPSPDEIMPGTDSSGHTYYSYAVDGRSTKTGNKLRVVSMAPSVTETVASVGGTDLIVGTDTYSDFPAVIKEKKASGEIAPTGGYSDPNYEWILKTTPDLVFCDGGVMAHVEMADKLRKSNIDCVVLYDCSKVETLYTNVWMAAAALGMSENANRVIKAISGTVSTIQGIGGETHKGVFLSLSTDPSPWTTGSNTFIDDIITKSGGRNVFGGQASSWFTVNKEQIMKKQPNVIIILMDSRSINTEEDYEYAIGELDSLWGNTPAFENGEIYIFSGKAASVLSRPGPRLGEAVELVAKILNQEAFTNKDPRDVIPYYFGDDYREYLNPSYQQAVFT